MNKPIFINNMIIVLSHQHDFFLEYAVGQNN